MTEQIFSMFIHWYSRIYRLEDIRETFFKRGLLWAILGMKNGILCIQFGWCCDYSGCWVMDEVGCGWKSSLEGVLGDYGVLRMIN